MEVRRPLRGQMWLKYGTVALLLWTGYFLLTHLTFPHPRPPGASLPGKTPQPVSAQRERPLNVTAAAMGDPPADPPIQFAAPLAAPATLDGAPEPDLDPCNTESPFFAGRSGMERDYLREVHHYAFGRAWGLGRDITDYIKGRGLQPKEKFLDFGSGALRNGIWLIKYLDTGNYYGIEHNTSMFEAGRDYELVLNGLQHKKPNLYNNVDGQPGLRQFGVKFDKIMAFAVLIHFTNVPGLKRTVLNAFVKYLQPEGTIYLSHHLPFSKETLAKDFGLKVAHKEHQKCKWSQSTNVWWELQHLDAPAQ